MPAGVAFVAQVLPAVPYLHPFSPALYLLAQILSFGYLWDRVRVQGGAYGTAAAYDSFRGFFSLTSYRDPNILQTLETFAGVVDFVRGGLDLSRRGLEQAIIGAMRNLDLPIRPSQAVGLALTRYLGGVTGERLAQFRQGLLSLTASTLRQAVEQVLAPALPTAPVCVIAGRDQLAAALPGGIASITDL